MFPSSDQEDAFYVLKKGEILGPFGLDELRSALAKGELSDRDLIQVDGLPLWQPLARLLANSDQEAVEAVASDWHTLSRSAWIRLRRDLDEQSLVTGAVCLGIGVLVMVVSNWPVLLWFPWFAAAVVAAIALLRRQRAEQALILLAGIVCLPFLFYVVGPRLLTGTGSVMSDETKMVAETIAPPPADLIPLSTPREEIAPAAKPRPKVILAEPLRVDPMEQPARVIPLPDEPNAPVSTPGNREAPLPNADAQPLL